MPPKNEKAVVTAPEIEKYANSALKKWVKALQSHRVLKTRALGSSKAEQHGPFHVELTICSAPRMKKLNEQYRGKASPTDVLMEAREMAKWERKLLGVGVKASLITRAREA